ncbi:MAG TPA: glycosyltransferase [Natronosporangium sp.]|nr:glycosyltransferase [Natronosporangium sp.]
MKVVVAHNRYRSAQPSGENRVVDAEIAQLAAAGVEVLPLLRSSDEIGSLPLRERVLLPLSPLWNPGTQRALAQLLREHRPDVLHLHNPYPLLSPAVVRTAHRYGVPVVHTAHNYRQVCPNGVYFRDGRICHDCRGRRLAVPAVVHRCYRGSAAQSAVMAVTLAAHRGTWRSVDRFLAPTAAIAAHLRGYGIPAERIVVKPNALPDPGPPDPLPPDGDLLFLGRLSAEKGVELLLDAWRRHPEGALGRLRVAGDGPLRPLVERAARARTDVTYAGRLDPDAARAALAASAAVVVPSTCEDVLPTVVIEALAAGRPVLGTALGGIPYLVGDAGWVVEPTVAAVAAALPAVRAEAASRSPAARARYESTFHPDVVTRQLLAVYESVRRAPGAGTA